MLRQFVKVSYDGKRVKIKYQVDRETGADPDMYSADSGEGPHPDFIAALAVLAVDLIEACEVPKVGGAVEMRGVSLSWSEDGEGSSVMGVTFTGLRKLERARAPLVLNSPHKFDAAHSGGDDADDFLLDELSVKRVMALLGEAAAFLDGKRAQGVLFEAAGTKAEAVEEGA